MSWGKGGGCQAPPSSSVPTVAWRGTLVLGARGDAPFVWRGLALLVCFLQLWVLEPLWGIIEVPPGLHYHSGLCVPVSLAVVMVSGCPRALGPRGVGAMFSSCCSLWGTDGGQEGRQDPSRRPGSWARRDTWPKRPLVPHVHHLARFCCSCENSF